MFNIAKNCLALGGGINASSAEVVVVNGCEFVAASLASVIRDFLWVAVAAALVVDVIDTDESLRSRSKRCRRSTPLLLPVVVVVIDPNSPLLLL